ncbi:NAD(P)H-dependent oxidoreductase [Arcobacter arenosus]|uniref:NAD(P)H-dependent oxidoreductase n=1 Tax=Arcobacter arenosus TaxID=2576037 RepID=A0A5R8XWZ3_9BACT|nr:NAD(P)H-dependent oxidoreductase [Arcobacter arenosus]TLP35181.1 NAD(P)H-dependent oxidoreductase [Arcobacter arenosus]
MKKVLIINGHQHYDGVAEGNLTNDLIKCAKTFFEKNDFEVKFTYVDKSYDIEEEKEKLVWADYIFFQYPVYWMGLPWITKKYFDEVLTSGIHYANDGRSREDKSKKYGSGGLLSGKYMLSLTYNCPTSEFSNKDGYFDGLSLDEANISTHKIFQFLGLEAMKTYSIHDIFKGDMDLEKELIRLEGVLKENFL